MISKWLERDDEYLMLKIQSASDAKKYLAVLYRQRENQVIVILAILILGFLGIFAMSVLAFLIQATFAGQFIASLIGIMLSLMAVVGINLLSIDTKIKIIKMGMLLMPSADH